MVLLERGDSNDNDELVAALKKLFTQIWEPIQAVMPATVQQVIISPDGQLNFVPFAALLNSREEFLAENLTVKYVTAGRDLLESLDPTTSTECVVFADPDFQGASVADDGPSANVLQPGYRGTEKREFAGLRFDSRSLIHTNEEVRNLEQHANDWGWHVAIFVGEKASKASLLRVQRPYVLHLATHGFFEPFSSGEPDGVTQSRPTRFSAGYFNNPMHRSGLALAGANRTLAAWEANKDVPLADDGILTAEDAVALDLKGTWLVALSACRTGQGEENAGEGVMGLRRGFLEAGAQNLLMTLWSVNDELTARLMSDFYSAAHETHNPSLALAKTQRDWLLELRRNKSLVEAVRLAGPFVLTFRGRP
jgi:CHAT domain-containing protein